MNKGKMYNQIKFLMLTMLLVVLVACGSNSSDESEADSIAEGESENNEETLTYVVANAFVDYASENREGGNKRAYYQINAFYDEVEERSNGRVKFEMHHNGQLVPPDQMLQALDAGSIDFGITVPQYYESVVPSGALGHMWFWADSKEQAHQLVTQTEIGEIMDREFEEQGSKVLLHGISANNVLITKFPVNSIDDLSGKVFRSGGDAENLFLDNLGVSGVSVAHTEIYEALQRGVIDGLIVDSTGVETLQWGEVSDYMFLPPFSVYPL